jgi:hypothetical protein
MNTKKTKVFELKKKRFLNWYFQDSDDTLDIGRRAITSLLDNGEFSINIQELLNSCCELPPYIMAKYDEHKNFDDEWITPDLIKLID